LKRIVLASAVASLLFASYDDNLDAYSISKKLALVVSSGREVSKHDRSSYQCLDRCLTDASRSEMRRRAVAATSLLGLACATPLAVLHTLPVACEPLPC